MDYEKVTPLFKYIGGKTWLKNHLRQELLYILSANKVETYIEPFSGGLGAFLGIQDLLRQNGINKVILNDINSKLINFYKTIQKESNDLIVAYVKLENEFSSLVPSKYFSLNPKLEKIEIKEILKLAEDFYIKTRNEFNSNSNSVENAARLLFLQKHCFNGIYRENSKGGYNTPFNWDGKSFSKEFIEEKINAIKALFSKFDIIFTNKSFIELEYVSTNLYYLDPPYINEDIGENKYNKDSFGIREQKKLIEKISKVPFIYSNHDNKILLDEFKKYNLDLHIRKIARKNIVSASAQSRKEDKLEILITNLNH